MKPVKQPVVSSFQYIINKLHEADPDLRSYTLDALKPNAKIDCIIEDAKKNHPNDIDDIIKRIAYKLALTNCEEKVYQLLDIVDTAYPKSQEEVLKCIMYGLARHPSENPGKFYKVLARAHDKCKHHFRSILCDILRHLAFYKNEVVAYQIVENVTEKYPTYCDDALNAMALCFAECGYTTYVNALLEKVEKTYPRYLVFVYCRAAAGFIRYGYNQEAYALVRKIEKNPHITSELLESIAISLKHEYQCIDRVIVMTVLEAMENKVTRDATAAILKKIGLSFDVEKLLSDYDRCVGRLEAENMRAERLRNNQPFSYPGWIMDHALSFPENQKLLAQAYREQNEIATKGRKLFSMG